MLVNAGGFARNQAMRDRYAPGTSVKWTMAAPGDTGEMIEEMMRPGAANAQMEERVGNQQTHPPGAEASDTNYGVVSRTELPTPSPAAHRGSHDMKRGRWYNSTKRRL